MFVRIPIVEDSSAKNVSVAGGPDSGHAGLRGLSNTSLVEEAARKALSAQELEKTIERFRTLCQDPAADVKALEDTAETLRNAGFKQELMRLLRDALAAPRVNPHVGAIWIRRVVTSKIWDHRYPDGLDALCKAGEVGRRAVIEFLEIAGPKRRSQLVLQAVARHQRWLRTHETGWAAAGRALVQARCYSKAVKWMSDWRRHDLDLPTMNCLALALRATGRMRVSDEVARLALARPSAADLFPLLTLWAAQDEAFAGDTQSASATFKRINPTGWDDDALALYYLVRGVIRVQKARNDDPKGTFEMARDRVRDLFRRVPVYKRDIYLRREYRRCISRMARDSGAWSERVLACWRSADSAWFLALLLVIPGLQLFVPCYLYRLCSRRRGVIK
ncbi:MAG TPA: hypothetical protein VFE51_26055 [Verrucomicrobiae bacterium]|nr:hypothetical protein [Verrucomicrobiae bacterium]